ncbi:MAG: phage tail sheath family protein [Methanothrix sp.]|nr:MAG: phage tail sheath family protein [Methanothrix sp.]
MPQYLTPGVYIEEIEIGAKPIEGVSTNVAGFLGSTERGPVEPFFVTSFDQFKKLYGGYIKDSYLAYSIEGYFRNGGASCFVARIASKTSIQSSVPVPSNPGGANAFQIDAIGPGKWGDGLKATIAASTIHGDDLSFFKLKLSYDKAIVEEYDNLSVSSESTDFFEKRINGISNFVTVAKLTASNPLLGEHSLGGGKDGDAINAEDYSGRELTIGENGTGRYTGLMGFDRISEISLICAPDENNVTGLSGKLIDHCNTHKDRFAILQAGDGKVDINKLNPSEPRSKYAAFYYPWIQILDPVTNMPKYVPPCGHVAGIYSRTDVERGVHKAPANAPVSGALGLMFNVVDEEQAILNPKGVNCIRSFLGRGILVWGARTTSLDSSWKYINVSRLFIFVEKSIKEGIRWAVFEPNNEKLWSRVKQTVDQFLTAVWRTGALMGTTADQAFFVRCDRTTMTQDDIDNGRLVVLVGIAPTKPAEFVVFRIAQVAKGSDITEA